MKDQYDFSRGKRGAIDPIPEGQTKIAIALDDDVINWFRDAVNAQNGGNYQALINDVLKSYIQNQN